MFYIFATIVTLIPAVFGAFMLLTPMQKLIAGVAWMRLPMPAEGSRAFAMLRLFWRSIGVVVCLISVLFAYFEFFRRG